MHTRGFRFVFSLIEVTRDLSSEIDPYPDSILFSIRMTMSSPSFIQFYPTLHCNQNCSFCFNQNIREASSYKDMTQDEAYFLVDILIKAGFHEVDILGGEPLLIPWIKNFIRLVTDSGITVNISTNGSLPEKVQELAEIPSDSMNVGFSLHGFPEIHNVLTASDNFSRVVQGIQIMIRAGKNPVVKSTLTRENKDQIHDLVIFLQNLGVKRYYLLYEDTIGRHNAAGFSFPEFRECFQKIKGSLEGTLDIGFVAASAFYKYGSRAQVRCDAGLTKVALLPDGSVFPCNLFFGFQEFCLGNIFKDDLKDILENPVLDTLKKFQGNQCLFSSCNHYSTCTGGCPAHSYFFHGSLDSADPRCIARRI
jgi:radical SAM protein with 4Fe4S-binding SPASM domain